jgi:hypothetical protein
LHRHDSTYLIPSAVLDWASGKGHGPPLAIKPLNFDYNVPRFSVEQ